jgi:hypothetical protein
VRDVARRVHRGEELTPLQIKEVLGWLIQIDSQGYKFPPEVFARGYDGLLFRDLKTGQVIAGFKRMIGNPRYTLLSDLDYSD